MTDENNMYEAVVEWYWQRKAEESSRSNICVSTTLPSTNPTRNSLISNQVTAQYLKLKPRP